MFQMTIKVSGKDPVDRVLSRLKQIPQDLTEPFKEVNKFLRDEWAKNFDNEGNPKWEELKPSTIRARGDSGHPIGYRTGNMKKDLTDDNNMGNNISIINKQSAVFGATGVKINSFHYGKNNKYGISNQVPRDLLSFSNRQEVAKIFQKYLYKEYQKVK